jgi:hypothetical protein
MKMGMEMKVIKSASYIKKMAGNFRHENKYLEEPFQIERNGITYNVKAPYSAEGVIRSENVTEFKGDLDREDNYVSRWLEEISVYIGDVEKVWDDQGKQYDPYKFIITPEEEQMMELEVKAFYENTI